MKLTLYIVNQYRNLPGEEELRELDVNDRYTLNP
jgi:hypothetical protein